jgi:hypothetical protein
MEVRAFPMDIRALEDDGRITAYASTFGNVYEVGWGAKEVIEKGAFAKTLKERTGRPILWQHNPAQPIGVELNAAEDDKGLLVEGQLNLEVQTAREARSLALQGAISGISMGFFPIIHEREPEKNLTRMKEVKLMEWSLVTFPANDRARIKKVRAGLENYPEALLYEIIGLAGDPIATTLDRSLITRAAEALLSVVDNLALSEPYEPEDTSTREADEPQGENPLDDTAVIARALAELGIIT